MVILTFNSWKGRSHTADDDDDGGDDDGEGDDDDDDDDDDGEDASDDDGEDDDDNDYGEDDEYVYVHKLLAQPPRRFFPFLCGITRQCEQLIRQERNWNLHESSRHAGRTLAVTTLTRCPASR